MAGAGLIGRRHAAIIAAAEDAELAGIADPSEAGRDVASGLGAAHFTDLAALIDQARPDALVIATPNRMHVRHGLAAVAAGLPALVEKPIADTVEGAARLVEAAEAAGVPLLIGHHRRHNPLIARAHEVIARGDLGRLVTVHCFFWLAKPDDYFDVDWRRQPGAGPVLVNLIHDIDLLRHLCGDVATVQAIESNAVRGHAVEDTAVALLRFANGALGTLTASDAVTAPWSWEQTAGENPAYPRTDQPCYLIAGTHGSLSLPQGELWTPEGARSWWEPLVRRRVHAPPADPLILQIEHFCRVVRGHEAPLVPGREGLASLKVIEALKTSAREGREVKIA